MDQRGAFDEMLGQRHDLARPIAQRRHANLDHVEAIIEVLAKALLAHRLFERLVGGGDDAGVDLRGRRAADPLESLVLQKAQQLGLQRGREVADLVEKDRAAVGRLEPARLVLDCAGERAANVSEQLAFQQMLAERGACDLDERALPARAELVDLSGRACSCRCRSRR